ncbi:hypothetical protein A7982_13981 [Minicystis rosea]|nr:hypothetical protein A7982_13981 [Minicystis rosea]
MSHCHHGSLIALSFAWRPSAECRTAASRAESYWIWAVRHNAGATA